MAYWDTHEDSWCHLFMDDTVANTVEDTNNDRDGTGVGLGISATTPGFGARSKETYSNWPNAYIDTQVHTILDGVFSVAFWVQSVSNPTDEQFAIMMQGDQTDGGSFINGRGLNIRLTADNPAKIQARIYDAASGTTGWLTSNLTIAQNQWRHIALTCNRASIGGFILYVDGVKQGELDAIGVGDLSFRPPLRLFQDLDLGTGAAQGWRGRGKDFFAFTRSLNNLEVNGLFLGPEPTPLTLPSITGTPQVGQTLNCALGTYDNWNNGAVSFEYQLFRDGNYISGTAGSTTDPNFIYNYVVQSADVGKDLEFQVRPSNNGGYWKWFLSAPFPVSNVPIFTVNPSINPAPEETGELHTCLPGTIDWRGDVGSVAYQWQNDDTGGVTPQDIVGATNQDYYPVVSDEGKTLRGEVTATNTSGSAVAYSPYTGIIADEPTPTTAPQISNQTDPGQDPEVGDTLSVSDGGWNWHGDVTNSFIYKWQRFVGGAWLDISGATSSTYPVVVADETFQLRSGVMADNKAGSSVWSYSAATAAVPGPQAQVTPHAYHRRHRTGLM